MRDRRRPLAMALLALLVLEAGCTSLREVPRSEFAARSLVPEVRDALKHGAAVQELLMEAGWRYLQALKHARRAG